MLFFINIIILIFNINFFYKSRTINIFKNIKTNIDKKIDIYRNVDYFPLKLFLKSYKKIAEYLTNKYYTKKDKLLSDFNNGKNNTIKTVKIYYVDLHPRFINLIKSDLKGKINIQIDKENPDYLLYATHGCHCMNIKYKNAIKLAFFTENQIPDLHFTDYAVGFSHISYLDRFFIYPYFIYHMIMNKVNKETIIKAREKVLKSPNRTKFCGAVITNPSGSRIMFINLLNKYKKIDMGGRYRNNVGGPVRRKRNFLSSYKFSICMENSEGDGYITEKIIDGFLAGTIPIYYGDYTFDEYINPKSFILIRNRNDVYKKINYIKKIDNDDELYKKILKEPIFMKDVFFEKIDKSRKSFLLNIFQQKKELAKRIDNY